MPAKDLVSQSRSLFGALRVAGWAPFLLLSSSCFPFCSLSSSFCLLPLCSLFCFFLFLALLLDSLYSPAAPKLGFESWEPGALETLAALALQRITGLLAHATGRGCCYSVLAAAFLTHHRTPWRSQTHGAV